MRSENRKEFDDVIKQVASQLKLDVEPVPLEEFIPLPPNSDSRRRFIGQYGNIDVYVFDPYSIALSKIVRGFDSDLEDVIFMLREKLINFSELERISTQYYQRHQKLILIGESSLNILMK